LSHDGWAIGGSPTLFSTGVSYGTASTATAGGFGNTTTTYPLSNNGWWGSPGSEHSGGANYGLGDGSVRFISSTISPNIFSLLGSMADRITVTIPEGS
jgi:prepilin-type processing-associated H-X9-DG protein